MIKKAYVEITNRCNLSCSFCPKTKREAKMMSVEEFSIAAKQLAGKVEFVYLHIMGEPLMHPQLNEILAVIKANGLKACLTTNGTLIKERGEILLAADCIYKISFSLHSLEGSGSGLDMHSYLESVWDFCMRAQEKNIYCVLRLWNGGEGQRERNGEILEFIESKLGYDPMSVKESRNHSRSFMKYLFLECENKFDWPDMNAEECGTQYCLGLRNQLGILSNGTVVPCCLDHEGDVPLGNIFETNIEDILQSSRAKSVYDGFSARNPKEELCRRCGFATRFNRKR